MNKNEIVCFINEATLNNTTQARQKLELYSNSIILNGPNFLKLILDQN